MAIMLTQSKERKIAIKLQELDRKLKTIDLRSILDASEAIESMDNTIGNQKNTIFRLKQELEEANQEIARLRGGAE